MTPHRYDLPTPIEIGVNPEIAPVALLHYAIDITARSLVAAYPELCEFDLPRLLSNSPSTLLAHVLLQQLDPLSELLSEYRTAVTIEASPGCRPASQRPDPF
jgi:hypothetical protein